MVVLKLKDSNDQVLEVNHCEEGVYMEIRTLGLDMFENIILDKYDVEELIKFLKNESRVD
jgi:hypothetical protein